MFKKLMDTLHIFICAVLIFQLVGCGTILHPERKGQKSGRLDVGIVVLDAIGLLFFFIPGIIAFAVDFSNGTIYLPGTASNSLNPKNIRQVKFDPKQSSIASIGETIKRETGYDVEQYRNNMNISKLESVDEMMVRFAEVLPKIQNTRVTLLTGNSCSGRESPDDHYFVGKRTSKDNSGYKKI